MSSRPLTVAVTGANSGIGLRAAEQLAAAGHHVHAICRHRGRGEEAVRRIDAMATGAPATLVIADLADPASVDAAATRLRAELDHLDVLICNAAVFDQSMRKARITAAGHELFWATNHLGPFQLTAALSPLLAAAPAPRLISVASKGLVTMPRIRIRFDELDSASWYSPTKAYYHAKLAQIMTTYSLALRAKGELDVACVRVPSVRVDDDKVAASPLLLRLLYAPRNRLCHPPERLGATYAHIAERVDSWQEHAVSEDGDRGRLRGIYLDERERPVDAPPFAYDADARVRLWNLSQAATGDHDWAW